VGLTAWDEDDAPATGHPATSPGLGPAAPIPSPALAPANVTVSNASTGSPVHALAQVKQAEGKCKQPEAVQALDVTVTSDAQAETAKARVTQAVGGDDEVVLPYVVVNIAVALPVRAKGDQVLIEC